MSRAQAKIEAPQLPLPAAGCRATAPETDDPLNRLLDAFEAQVEALLDNGLEVQVRARLMRLLPPEPAAGNGQQAAAAGCPLPAAHFSDIDRALGFANLDATLMRFRHRARNEAERKHLDASREFVAAEIEGLKVGSRQQAAGSREGAAA